MTKEQGQSKEGQAAQEQARQSEVGTAGHFRRVRQVLPYLGPAFLVSVGYMDPGNWATDIEAGARFNYDLLWVLLLSNIMAIVLQSLSAKLGLVTGRDLAQMCREEFSRPVRIFLWVTAEGAMMATDLAEFLGSALGIYLLFHIPLNIAIVITGLDVFIILGLQRYGYRVVEYVIIGFVAVIGWCYAVELVLAAPDWGAVGYHMVVPKINSESIYVAIGMLGATVMPHNLYLHSALIQTRRLRGEKPRKLFLFSVVDSLMALNGAWMVNSAMVIMSAAVFFRGGMQVASIEAAHSTLAPILGSFSSLAFAIALLCAGISSSVTGTFAGQVVMEGFLQIRLKLWLRRLLTRLIVMIPAFIAVGVGVEPLRILVLSQVALSFQLPFAIIPLIMFTKKRRIMGEYANGGWMNLVAGVIAALIIGLNMLLLVRAFGGKF